MNRPMSIAYTQPWGRSGVLTDSPVVSTTVRVAVPGRMSARNLVCVGGSIGSEWYHSSQ